MSNVIPMPSRGQNVFCRRRYWRQSNGCRPFSMFSKALMFICAKYVVSCQCSNDLDREYRLCFQCNSEPHVGFLEASSRSASVCQHPSKCVRRPSLASFHFRNRRLNAYRHDVRRLSQSLHFAFEGFCWIYLRFGVCDAVLGVCFPAQCQMSSLDSYAIFLASLNFASVCQQRALRHPETEILKLHQDPNTREISGLFLASSNLLSEKNKFCLSALLVSCLIFELHKTSWL